MAKRFLTHVDLTGNQILNASFEKLAAAPGSDNFEGRMYYDTALNIVRVYIDSAWVDSGIPIVASDPATGNYEGRIIYNTAADSIKYYDGSAWHPLGEGSITSVSGTAGEVDVSTVGGAVTISLPTNIAANASSADKWSTSRTVTFATGDVTGSFSIDGSANVSDVALSIAANSVALGTDTTGNYVASVGGTDGVSVSGTGEGAAVTIANTDKGSSQNIFKNVAVSGQNTIVADQNNDTLNVSAGTGITVTTDDTTDTLTVTNAGVTSITGTTNQVNASASTGSVTLSLPQDIHSGANPTFAGVNAGNINVGITGDNEIDTDTGNLTIDSAGGTVTVDDNLIVTGDLTVNGTTTTLNTTELLVEDNIITLNSGATGTPSLNAGIEVERGDDPNVVLRWNETSNTWELTRDGTNYEEITTVGTVTSGDISDFTEAAQDAVGGILVDGTTVDFTYADGTPSITAEVKLATTSYLATTGGLAVDKSTLETALVTDGFTKKYAASIGNGVLTSIAVTHNLGTRDVQVQVYDNATYDTVETDVVRTDTNTVTVSFTQAPASNAYRVVVIG